MAYSRKFKNLVLIAKKETDNFYQKNDPETASNPFYIGFGNPNSDILLIGKEKAFSKKKLEQLKFESIQNPIEWNHYIENSTSYNKNKFWKNSVNYLNAFYPYQKNNRGGATWAKYESIVNRILQKKIINYNDFFKDAFLTEINYVPSKTSQISKFDEDQRKIFLKNPYYKSFKITILGCNKYLNREEIEDIFDVKFEEDLTDKYRFIVYKNKDRILINTRQLSGSILGTYLQKIADKVRTYL